MALRLEKLLKASRKRTTAVGGDIGETSYAPGLIVKPKVPE